MVFGISNHMRKRSCLGLYAKCSKKFRPSITASEPSSYLAIQSHVQPTLVVYHPAGRIWHPSKRSNSSPTISALSPTRSSPYVVPSLGADFGVAGQNFFFFSDWGAESSAPASNLNNPQSQAAIFDITHSPMNPVR